VSFDTQLTITGPWRAPAQMLADQEVDGHASVHDEATASRLGLLGAPIEGCTHFSQFDPLGFELWGQAWFERGCISAHFRTMVIEGEQVQASATTVEPNLARIEAHKADGTPVLEGTISLGPDHPQTALDARRAAQGDPGDLFIVDCLEVGATNTDGPVTLDHTSGNGGGYPFSLDDKLAKITELSPWYTADGAASGPWGREVVPMEMISVLANKSHRGFPVRGPALGLFLDLEIRLVDGPVFVDQPYLLRREIVGLSQSKRTESYWTRTELVEPDTERVAAVVLLHSGVFKESFADYPKDRLR
jgi:hypothetical protein